MLDKGIAKPEETPAPRPAGTRAPVVEKASPPPFEAPARGVIVASGSRPPTARACVDCGAALPASQRVADGAVRCAECAATSG